jgi:hypothetical protein
MFRLAGSEGREGARSPASNRIGRRARIAPARPATGIPEVPTVADRMRRLLGLHGPSSARAVRRSLFVLGWATYGLLVEFPNWSVVARTPSLVIEIRTPLVAS